MWQRVTEAFRWFRQELRRVHQEETERKKLERFPEWTKGLDPTGIPTEANLLKAEDELRALEFESDIRTYIAGISEPRYRDPWQMTEQIAQLASSPLYRMAMVRMLVREGAWTTEGYFNLFDINALQLYAWTGFQQEMLPWNPLFAFVQPGTYKLSSLLDRSGLQHWIEKASDEELRAVQKWNSWWVEKTDPELHQWYIDVLTKVGLERLLYILEVISDPEFLSEAEHSGSAHENIGRLTDAIAHCVKAQLKVGPDKTVTAKGFFSSTLGEGIEKPRD
jgi:hypothetical protein